MKLTGSCLSRVRTVEDYTMFVASHWEDPLREIICTTIDRHSDLLRSGPQILVTTLHLF